MFPQRITNLNIERRSPFTAIYGHTHEVFIGNDLKLLSFDQALYLYLKSKAYDTVLFYDLEHLFYSFTQKDLLDFQNINNNHIGSTAETNRYTAQHIKSPLRGMLRKVSNSAAQPQTTTLPAHQSIVVEEPNNSFQFYRLRENPEIRRRLTRVFSTMDKHTALIIKAPSANSNLGIENNETAFLTVLINFDNKTITRNLRHKVIIVYESVGAQGLIEMFNDITNKMMFFATFFKEKFTTSIAGADNNARTISANCFFVDIPDEQEIKNFLLRKRLLDNYELDFLRLNRVVGNLYRESEKKEWTGAKLRDIKFSEINRFQDSNIRTASDRLKELIGLSEVKEEVDKYLLFEKYIRNQGGKDDTSKHLVLTGNPGTGKTEIARLIAEIFKEEGILRRGQFIEAKKDDLVAGYVGQTAIKTMELCQKALGGVLFIDEAYQITGNDAGGDDFGKEAVATLLKFMEDHRDDIVVIVAGYEKEMNNFLKSNPGLESRFPKKIHFPDYTADELTAIFFLMVDKRELVMDDNFKTTIKIVIKVLYKYRHRNFGNARVIRTLLEQILRNYGVRCERNGLQKDVLRVEDIPTDYSSLISKKSDISIVKEVLTDKVFGQQDNIPLIIRPLKSWLRMAQKDKPLNYFFVGTSGVGKTYTAELMAAHLKTFSFDYVYLPMTEYQQESAINNLIGSAKGYVGSTDEPLLFERHRKNSRLLIVFDEIEKAHTRIFTLFMQLLDKGTLAWNDDQRNFNECIIVFTSNIAMKQIVQLKKSYQETNPAAIGSADFQNKVRDILQEGGIKPEICGRVKNYIVFNQLDKNAGKKIADAEIRKLANRYKLKVRHIDEGILDLLAAGCEDSFYGARPIIDEVEHRLGELLADIDLDSEEGAMVIDIFLKGGDFFTEIVKS